MKKFLFLILMLFIFASCTTQKSITSEKKVNVYNMYGQKIIEVYPNLDNISQQGVYYIQVIENSENSPYWTKKVVIEL